jgi:hypothetical protein
MLLGIHMFATSTVYIVSGGRSLHLVIEVMPSNPPRARIVDSIWPDYDICAQAKPPILPSKFDLLITSIVKF